MKNDVISTRLLGFPCAGNYVIGSTSYLHTLTCVFYMCCWGQFWVHNTLLCWNLQTRQLLNHFDATARHMSAPGRSCAVMVQASQDRMAWSVNSGCRSLLLPPSSSSVSLFSVCCQNMPWPQGGGGCHMLLQMPVLINCRYLRTVSVQHIYTRIPIHIRMYAVWLEPGKIYSMLLIELNWTCAQFDELRFSCDLWFMPTRQHSQPAVRICRQCPGARGRVAPPSSLSPEASAVPPVLNQLNQFPVTVPRHLSFYSQNLLQFCWWLHTLMK